MAAGKRPGDLVKETVLVVDDNQDSVTIARSILEARGFTVLVAYDGATALGVVEESKPDVVLLDVMMPEMGGMEVLDRLKHSPTTAHIPVILLTAKAQDEDVLTGYKGGADYYITKPFTPKQLVYGIQLVLGNNDGPS